MGDMDGTPIDLKSEDSVEYPASLVEWMRENQIPCAATKPELLNAIKDGADLPEALAEKVEVAALKVAEQTKVETL